MSKWPRSISSDDALDSIVYAIHMHLTDTKLKRASFHLFVEHSLSFALRPVITMLIGHIEEQIRICDPMALCCGGQMQGGV